MFWQGGAKKRMQEMIQTRLQPIRQHTDLSTITIARRDDELLKLYYYRDQLSILTENKITHQYYPKDRLSINQVISSKKQIQSMHNGSAYLNETQEKKKPQKQMQIRSKKHIIQQMSGQRQNRSKYKKSEQKQSIRKENGNQEIKSNWMLASKSNNPNNSRINNIMKKLTYKFEY